MSVRYGLTNLSQGSLFGITRLRRVMPNSDPRDRFVDLYLTLMIDSFSCTLFCAKACISLTLKYAKHSCLPFCFDIILWRSCDVRKRPCYMTSITTNIKHRVKTPGSEHQGQTSISDPDQNLGCICILSSGVQESTIPLLPISKIFKPQAILCDCTAKFVMDTVKPTETSMMYFQDKVHKSYTHHTL